MKKILSVALSTAMAFSMFASVAFGADATTTPDQKFEALKTAGIVNGLPDGLAHLDKTLTRAELAKIITKSLGLKEVTGVYTYKDNNYGPNHWAAPFIEAVTSAKIMQGSVVNGKQFFNPNGNVTAQELAIVLTRALNLEVPTTDITNDAAAWAKGEVQAAINAGLLDANTPWTAAATRSQAIVAAYAVWEKAQLPTVSEAKVIDATHVDVTLSTGEVVKVELTTPLVANVETPIEFKDAAGNTLSTKVTYVVTTATKVASVTATNLKEVVVAFDGEVDKVTAEDASNYTLDNAATVTGAALSDDKKTVTLTVAGHLTNQTEYKLSVNNVKAGDKVISAKDVAFTPVDAAIPTVQSVTALGNKAVKIVFSEPVDKTTVTGAGFKLNGLALVGNVVADDTNSVIVQVYSPLANGTNNVTVSGIKDFAGYTLITTTQDFEVVEDKAAPTIKSVTASYEKATVEFSEPVQNVRGGTYAYWKPTTSSSTKYYSDATVNKVNDSTYEFTFTGSNKLPGYEVSLYIEGVKDYSDNVIATDTPVAVNAQLDVTRPEVANVTVANDSKSITVKYSKVISNITDRTKYTLLDEDGNAVSVKDVTSTDSKTASINFYSALAAGDYTLKIEGLTDNTTLANSILPYSATVSVADKANPNVSDISLQGNNILVNYDKAMATSGNGSIADLNNYYITYDGALIRVPSNTSVQILDGGKTALLVLPSTINGSAYDAAKISKITVSGVQDANGNVLNGFSQDESGVALAPNFVLATDSGLSRPNVALTDSRTIKAVFNQSIGSGVDASDFTLDNADGATIQSFQVDGNTVILTLDKDFYGQAVGASAPTLSVTGNSFKSILGADVTASPAATIIDKVAPTLAADQDPSTTGTQSDLQNTGNDILVRFNEAITPTNAANMAFDFIVKRVNGDKTLTPGVAAGAGVDYITTVDANGVVHIQLQNTPNVNGASSFFTVQLKSNPVFVKDTSVNGGNAALAFGPIANQTQFLSALDAALDNAETAVAAYEALPLTTDAEIATAIANDGTAATNAITAATTAGATTAETNALTARVNTKKAAVATAATISTVTVADANIGNAANTTVQVNAVAKNAAGVTLSTALTGDYAVTYNWTVESATDAATTVNTAAPSDLAFSSATAANPTITKANAADVGDNYGIKVAVTQDSTTKNGTATVTVN